MDYSLRGFWIGYHMWLRLGKSDGCILYLLVSLTTGQGSTLSTSVKIKDETYSVNNEQDQNL